jgi:hypothetical protein
VRSFAKVCRWAVVQADAPDCIAVRLGLLLVHVVMQTYLPSVTQRNKMVDIQITSSRPEKRFRTTSYSKSKNENHETCS